MAPPDLIPRALSATMANGIDRLERLFSKKKYAAASREQQQAADYAPPPTSYSSRFALRKGSAAAAPPSSPTRYSPLNDMHFPQPSFIRPKAARMIPRDDHAYAPTSPSRPGTANRSMSVPEGPPTLPQLTATVLASPTSPTRVVAPPRSAGGLTTTATATSSTTRSPHGPPVAYQPRSMSVTSPHRRTFDSRRSSGSINYNYCSTSATLSSSGSSTMSASTHTSNGSSNHPNRRSSYIETPCELSDAAARAVPTNNGRILASVNVQRLPKRSSSLLQRRDVFVSPLANLDTYQVSNTGRRDSVAITVSSCEISPATIQATPIIPSSSPASPKENQQEQQQQQQPELKIQGDELHELREMQGLSDDLQHTPPFKDLQQQLFFVETTENTEAKVEEVPASTSPKQSELPIFTETPLLRRDSVFAPIVLPQSRPTSPSVSAVSARRQSRLARRPMSLRYQRHLPIEPKPSSPSSVLMEPDLGDFLSLSDDDIAEDVAAAAAAAAATATTAEATEATSTVPVAEVVEEKKEEEVSKTSTPRASMVPLPAETPAAATEDVPPTTPPKTPQQVKSALALQKPLPPAPTEATPPATSSPPVSPNSVVRRRALAATAPSLPPAFQAPPPAFLSLLPGMPLLPSPMSVTPSASAVGRPRTPAGEARMAAAFEIARIASQYKFDLAYIATIWPKNMAFPISSAASASASASTTISTATRPQSIGWPSSPTSPSGANANKMSRNNSQTSSRPPLSGRGANRASHVSHGSQNSFVSQSSSTSTSASTTSKQHSGVFSPVGMRQSKLEAQFLAAYGLATVRAPYSLSAPTHAKILNAERWLEFSEPDAQPDEFSRGYGCAFYPGRTPVNNTAVTTATGSSTTTPVSRQRFQRRPSTDDCDADTEQDARAAVSRPRRKASTSSASSSNANNSGIVFVAYRRKEVVDERARRQEKDDLEALYRDVEALVGKILDVHMQQQRQAHLDTQRALPDVQDVLAAGGFPGVGAACTLRQSRFLGVKAA